ncbi:hypothetical protein [Arthrobacter sp. PsM3]|uniref:hypothetical protein n=1 Tax=Arthrobacter sp. PsM3 TaxID=3030531 RepID=UPI00263B546A|nr:hypothetical protein [Arthrobacter sp. PsM3]MDN4644374.1 hypothetical protein [Arthrobacter sp. PsM3]
MTEALSSLAEAFKNVGVSRAYGPAVTVEGEELIPVALVSFGFGGGQSAGGGDAAGRKAVGGNAVAGNAAGNAPLDGSPENAAGGGGGGFVLPLGVYCRGRNGRVAFRPNSIAVLAGLVPLVCAVGIAVRGALRALHRR